MKLKNLLQLVDKLQQSGKIDNLQQVGGVFGCVAGEMSQALVTKPQSLYTIKL